MFSKFASGAAVAALLTIGLASHSANATASIDIYDTLGYFEPLNAFFEDGYTVNHITDFSAISGASLVIVVEPSRFFNFTQTNLLRDYVSTGGRLIVNDDLGAAGFGPYVNRLLAAVGSTMRTEDVYYDSAFNTTTRNIVANSFTVGVNAIEYHGSRSITGGTALVRGLANQTLVSYEAVGSGYVFAIADADLASSAAVFSRHDNDTLYCNFGNLSCAPPGGGAPEPAPTGGVPEPASWALMIAGFGTVGAVLRRRRKVAAV